MKMLIAVFFLIVLSAAGQARSGSLTVTDLQCSSLHNPLSVEAAQPTLSWLLQSRQRDAGQTAYRVLVASQPGLLEKSQADLWDSGKVVAAQSTHVLYAGKPLRAQLQVWWQVQVWDKRDRVSAWSKPASWTMGLLRPSDWQARWISAHAAGIGSAPAPLLRRDFVVNRRLKRAVAYICGLGYSELYLNGGKVGDHVLDPAQTDYERRAFYVAYDVTSLLKPGANAVGIMLGNGFYNQDRVWGGMSYGKPQVIFQLQLEYADGQTEQVLSDSDWRTMAGPVLSNNVYAGETYDARREMLHWSEAGYDAKQWDAAEVVAAPTAQLVAQMMPPIKRIQTLTPVRLTHPQPGLNVYDMGQNFAGWARLQVQARGGTTIKLRFAEAIHADGTLDMASTGVFATGVEQTDNYICKGGDVEIWEPRFTYHGFRYVELSGLPNATLDNLQGVVVHTAVEPTGSFQCSDATLNRIHQVALWTELSNLVGCPTDCPAREKCGWLGDAHISAEMTMYNFDMSSFWPKYIDDIATSWRGALPGNVAPGKRGSGPNGNLDWGVACVLLPWYQYLYYGDARLLREHYPAMRKFLRHASALGKDGIFSKGYGDWCPPGSVQPVETPVALTTTAYLYRAAQIVASTAHILGDEAEAKEFEQLQETIGHAFNQHFLQRPTHTYGSQTANSLALAFGLAPTGEESPVAASLARDVVKTHHGHLATGIFGSRYLYGALSDSGYGAVARGILHQTTYPSLGDLFARGATTFWECWGEPELDQKWGARSQNHAMQGAFDAWFYQGVAGINPVAEAPGFKHILLRPTYTGQLQWARASYGCPYGLIQSAWRHDGNTFYWQITVPVNTTASIYIPAHNPQTITESGKPANGVAGVRYGGKTAGALRYELGSGSYQFVAP